jgi:flagellar capping protein FliD
MRSQFDVRLQVGGADFDFELDVNGNVLGQGAARTDFANVISTGKKAFYLLNELSMSSLSNKDETTIVGTKIHLKKADPTETVKLTLNRDPNLVLEKVREFIVAYNGVIKFINDNSKVEIKDKDANSTLLEQLQGNSGNKTTVERGPFAGDSSILGLKQQLQNLMTSRIPELSEQGLSQYSSLAAIGVTTKRNDGTLDIDEERFKEALDVDFEGVRRLFITYGYSDNPDLEYGTSTKDTRTGVYSVNTATNQFDTKRLASEIVYGNGTLSAGGIVLNSESGDSKGLAVKFGAATTGSMTFIRGIAGQVKAWHDQINDFVNGFSSETKKTLDRRIKDETKRIDKLESQVDRFRQRLIAQFSNLEISIARLQQQSGAFQQSAIGFSRR